jgi:hypothetical protein
MTNFHFSAPPSKFWLEDNQRRGRKISASIRQGCVGGEWQCGCISTSHNFTFNIHAVQFLARLCGTTHRSPGHQRINPHKLSPEVVCIYATISPLIEKECHAPKNNEIEEWDSYATFNPLTFPIPLFNCSSLCNFLLTPHTTQ